MSDIKIKRSTSIKLFNLNNPKDPYIQITPDPTGFDIDEDVLYYVGLGRLMFESNEYITEHVGTKKELFVYFLGHLEMDYVQYEQTLESIGVKLRIVDSSIDDLGWEKIITQPIFKNTTGKIETKRELMNHVRDILLSGAPPNMLNENWKEVLSPVLNDMGYKLSE